MPRPKERSTGSVVPQESQVYTASYRAVAAEGFVKVYNGAGKVEVARAMSFDNMDPRFSSVDMVASALLSEVLLVCTAEFAAAGEQLMDLEGRAVVELSDPLVLAGVRGVQGAPRIMRAGVDVYLFTFLEESEARQVIERALERAVVYQSLRQAFDVDVRFSFAV